MHGALGESARAICREPDRPLGDDGPGPWLEAGPATGPD